MNSKTNRDEKRDMIYLAALLHDIGKFFQRADKSFADKNNALSAYSKNLANDICPVNDQGRFSYQHVVWTNEFFEKTKEVFNKVPGLRINPYENKDMDNLVTFACNHHRPQTLWQAIVTMADGWSAGIDRLSPSDLKKKDYASKKVDWGKLSYKTVPLFSVFNKLNGGKGNKAFKLKALNIDKVFPAEINKKEDGISEAEYKDLWKGFTSELKELPTDSIYGFTESLLFLLKKYTWCIPSNTMDMADVSLFEHLKTTAALADSIYCYYQKHPDDFNWNEADKRLTLKADKHPVLMLGVDISGIQKFIYHIASSKAAKSLKGRSFYLQLLIDAMIQRIVTHPDINATLGHVVYSSGGKCYMILPNTQEVLNALSDLKKEFERDLWNEHKGRISVNFGYKGFTYRFKKENDEWISWIEIEDTIGRRQLNELWKAVADEINLAKNRQFESLLLEKYDDFFDEKSDKLEVKEHQEICAVTGEELDQSNRKELDKDADKNPVYVSKSVFDQVKLGTVLKDADYLIVFKGQAKDDEYLSNWAKTRISILGLNYYLFDQNELTIDDAEFRGISSADTSRVYRINTTDFLAAKLKGQGVSYGFLFYGGNNQALMPNRNEKTFEQLTQTIAGDKESETYFGVLRMDIDSLGNIFIKGFDKQDRSFASYATLSFMLDWFFSGYLNTIRNSEAFSDWVNILYSGGDDVFAVGRWDKVIAFARKVELDFKKFTGRDDITLSGGMATVRNKFPIAKAADLAGEAEEAAKKFNGEQKNAFTFFGETISWKDDYDFVEKYKKDFIDRIGGTNGKAMSKAVLHRLMIFAEIKKHNNKELNKDPGFKPDLSYKWNTAYYLKRFSQRHKQNGQEVHKDFIMHKLIKDLFTDTAENRHYERIALACRWAELELKTEKQFNTNIKTLCHEQLYKISATKIKNSVDSK